MICRLIILLLIVGCGTEPEYQSVYDYPDFETICGMDEQGNPTENIGDGICGLCIDQGSPIEQESISGGTNTMPERAVPDIGVSTLFSLSSPYPNPFKKITSLDMSIPNVTDVEVYVLDTEYNKIATLKSGQMETGIYSIVWNSLIFPIGYYRIVADFGDIECFSNVHKSDGCVNNTVSDECGECGGNGADESEVALWGECYSIVETDSLNFFSSGIGVGLIPEVCDLTNLKYLNLSRNQLTNLQDCFGNLISLEVLRLSNNQLTSLPENIGNLNSLKELSLSFNKLTTLPESIGSLSSLMALGITSNQITNLPESIGSLSNLINLHISDNQLIALPNSINNLINLKFLYLSGNQLTTLPDSIGNLINLLRLGLQDNKLTTLSNSISNLNKLEALKLHNNQLTTIPENICSLTNLNWSLTDSYDKSTIYNNQLCPPYPDCLDEYIGTQDTSNCP